MSHSKIANKPFPVRDKREPGRYFIDNELLRGGWGAVLGPYGIAVYDALALHVDNDNQLCWPSFETIAKMTGMSRPTVIKAVATLERLRLIAVERKTNRSNTYHLLDKSKWAGVKDVDSEEESGPDPRVKEIDPGVKEIDPGVKEIDPNYTHVTKPIEQKEHADDKPRRQRKPRPLDVLRADLETHFLEVTGLPPPSTNTDKQRRAAGALWWKPLMQLAGACDNDAKRTKQLMDWAIAEMDKIGWKVSSPNSIVKTALAELGNRKRKAGKTRPLQGDEPQRKVLSDEEGEKYQRQMEAKMKAKREREKQEAVAVA